MKKLLFILISVLIVGVGVGNSANLNQKGAQMPSIFISPNPASSGTTSLATGTGFPANVELHVTEQNPVSLFFFSAQTDGSGNVEFSVYADVPGDVVVKVYENDHGNKYKLVVEATLSVS